MKKDLRILIVEDVSTDVVLINRELRKGGLHFYSKRVDNKDEFLREIQHNRPDIILSDHGLPSFDGFTALAIAHDRCPDVPFIFVTGTLGEEVAIETIKSGATDYVLKNKIGSNLVPAVQRAIRETEERVRRREAEMALRESEARFRMLVEGVKDYAIFMLNPSGYISSWNSGAEWVKGYKAVEIMGQPFSTFYRQDDITSGKPQLALRQAAAEGRYEEEGWRLRKGGAQFWANVIITALRDENGQLIGFVHVTRDVTERKEALEALQRSEDRYRRLVELCPDTLLVVCDGQIVFANSAALKLLEIDRQENLIGKTIKLIIPSAEWKSAQEKIRAVLEHNTTIDFIEQQFIHLSGSPLEVEWAAAPFTFQNRRAVLMILHDVSERKRVAAALQKSEARKTAVLEAAIDAIISIDASGAIRDWNPAAEKMFGYSRKEALEQKFDDLIIPATLLKTYREGLANYLITGAGSLIGRPIELTAKRANGDEFPADLAITRVATEELLFTCFVRDITERKRSLEALKKSETLYRTLVDGVSDYAIYMLDPAGRIATWNKGAERIKGYNSDEIIGKSLSTFFTDEDIQNGLPEQLLKQASANNQEFNEGWRVRKDGTKFWIKGIITALRDEHGLLYGFAQVSHDTTRQKQAEEEIHRLNVSLEKRVSDRTAQLEAANKELEAFSYSVSHDLRAPLRHINGFVDILKTNASSQLDESNREILQTIATSAQQMGKLIDDLLAFSKMGRAEMRKIPVHLDEIIAAIRHDLRHELQGRKVNWRLTRMPRVWGDPAMLRQVMLNLINNALKYSRPRTETTIEIGYSETAEEIVFFVRDNGVGFDMKYADKLFGVFQRLHRASEFEGTGIGLANVRRIVDRHEGRTWAESTIGEGATFYFSLPKLNGGNYDTN